MQPSKAGCIGNDDDYSSVEQLLCAHASASSRSGNANFTNEKGSMALGVNVSEDIP